MRVLRLAMSAFGPFPGTEEIDFTRLGDHPLFLINGPTGSGKTTILDAICYALYGETTGTERDGGEMRCDHAQPDQTTRVEVEFELGSTRYRVGRTPEQDRPKRRGEGTTRQSSEAQLYQLQEDGEEKVLVPRKVNEVNSKIVELTGLSGEQFRQIMVLPQGKFRNFLLAGSDERQKIFTTLFGTQVYSRLEAMLREDANRLVREVKALGDQQAGMLETVGLETAAELKAAITAKEIEARHAKSAVTEASQALDDARRRRVEAEKTELIFSELDAARGNLERLSSRDEEFGALAETLEHARLARDLYPVLERREDQERAQREALEVEQSARASLKSAVELHDAAQSTWEKAQREEPRLDELKAQRTQLERHRERVTRLTAAMTELDTATKQRTDAEDGFNAAMAHRQQAADERERLEKAREELQKSAMAAPGLAAEVDNLKRLHKTLADGEALRLKIEEFDGRITEGQAELERAEKTLESKTAERNRLEQRWHDAQASILAGRLQAREPCPVCGSIDHPAPAVAGPDVPAEEDVNEAKTAEASAGSHKNDVYTRLHTLQAQRSENAAQLEKMLAGMENPERLSAEQVETELGSVEGRFNEVVDAPAQLEQNTRALQDAESSLKSAEQALETARTTLDSAKGSEITSREKVRGIEQELPEEFRAPGALETEIETRTRAVAGLEQQIQSARRALTEAEKARVEADTSLKAAEGQLVQAAKRLERVQTQWVQELLVSRFDDEAQVRAAIIAKADEEEKKSQLEEHKKAKLLAKAEVDRLTGESRDKSRPDMESIRLSESDAAAKSDQATGHYHRLDGESNNLREVDRKLADLGRAQQKLENEYALLGKLSDVANGQNAYRTSLQRFVLGVLLDDVLIEAGHRLLKMSRGRYQLRRNEELTDRRSASGLELVVDDAYTGKSRNVATLSGGESFLAALSLALGLSAVVQAYAGGIRLDTLFIDEGFGSLDSEALDLAINTLLELQSAGVTVGVISHVGELKERMDTRIDLHTGRQGSRAEIVTP